MGSDVDRTARHLMAPDDQGATGRTEARDLGFRFSRPHLERVILRDSEGIATTLDDPAV